MREGRGKEWFLEMIVYGKVSIVRYDRLFYFGKNV